MESIGNIWNLALFTLISGWILMSEKPVRIGDVVAGTELRPIRSDIRFEIDRLFRENDIVIAFPQRDVHLDTSRPLEVRMQREVAG